MQIFIHRPAHLVTIATPVMTAGIDWLLALENSREHFGFQTDVVKTGYGTLCEKVHYRSLSRSVEDDTMKVVSVGYTENGDKRSAGENCVVQGVELDAEQYAQLRLLIDESAILESTNSFCKQASEGANIHVIVQTSEGTYSATFSKSAIPSEVTELIDYLKELNSLHYPPVSQSELGMGSRS